MKIKALLSVIFLLYSINVNATTVVNKPESVTITILQLNDVYEIAPVDNGKRGGLARVANLLNQERARNPQSLFLLAGDFLYPSVASKEFKGEQMIDVLNNLHLDAAVFGNHEFDLDSATLEERIAESNFPYLGANIFDKNNPSELFGGAKPYIIKNMGGVQVAIFGLLTSSPRGKFSDDSVIIKDPLVAGQKLAHHLRRQGADVIIALTHLSLCEDKQLASIADIDLIIGGHDHELLQSLSGKVLISKMGSDARNLGRIDLHLAPSKGGHFKLKDLDWQSLAVDSRVKEDQEISQLVNKWERRLLKKYLGFDKKLSATSVELEALDNQIRYRETNFGDLVADAYRFAFKKKADIALFSAGSVKMEAPYEPGLITERYLSKILPYNNTLIEARIKGKKIKDILEHSVSRVEYGAGAFLQVSGLSFSYDLRKPSGQRVSDIKINGKNLLNDKYYTLVTSSYLFEGGEGYDFTGAERLTKRGEGPKDKAAVIKFIKSRKSLAPKAEGRIKSLYNNKPLEILDSCSLSS